MRRNACIDFMKCIAALMVIVIHMPFQGTFGEWIMPLTRAAVPFFFLVSGYYLEPFGNIKKKITKTATLLLLANIGYLMWGITLTLLKGDTISTYVQKSFNTENFLSFLFLNESPFAIHLWFLGALLYAQIILLFLSHIRPFQKVYILIPLLLLIELAFGKYSLLLFQREFDYCYVRNFAFIGLPYLLLGHCISFYQNKLFNLKDSVVVSAVLFFSLSTIAERQILAVFSVNGAREHYISNIFLVIFLLIFAIKHPLFGNGTKIADWGRRYSLTIYLVHMVFLSLLKYLFREQKNMPYYQMMILLLTVFLTLSFCYLLSRCSDWKKRNSVSV